MGVICFECDWIHFASYICNSIQIVRGINLIFKMREIKSDELFFIFNILVGDENCEKPSKKLSQNFN